MYSCPVLNFAMALTREQTAFRQALTAASPRLTHRPMPVLSALIYFGVIALWLILFARAFWLDGVIAWSAGIVYILYDTALMVLIAVQTWPMIAAGGNTETAANSGNSQSLETSPSIGVIIAAYNEAAVLPATLAALRAQSIAPDRILIADDGSTDGTGLILTEQFGLHAPHIGELSAPGTIDPSIQWLRLPRSGKADALNAAVAKLDTDIVVIVDADTHLAIDGICHMRQAFAGNARLVAAGGILIPVCDETFIGRLFQMFQRYEYIRNNISRFAWMRMQSLLLISGAFAGFRRDALLAVGGFDQESFVEDYELTHRLHRYSIDHGLGWQLATIGAAHATTEAPSRFGTFLAQRRRWFAGFLQTQYWNRDMTGSRHYGKLGTTMLPIKALDTVQPIYGLTAIVLLVILVSRGQFEIAAFVFSIVGAKLAVDFAFQIWTMHLYRRLTGDRANYSTAGALFAAAIEPFSFQVLRHLGAAWGWLSFLTRTQRWGHQSRARFNLAIGDRRTIGSPLKTRSQRGSTTRH